jgi:hypothetical protein
MTEQEYLIRYLAEECERAARFIRFYSGNARELRAWAGRIESGFASNSVCLPAELLERAAKEARAALSTLKAPS